MGTGEGLDNDHRRNAELAHEGGPSAVAGSTANAGVSGRNRRWLMQKFASSGDMDLAVGVGEQAIVAGAGEATGAHVQQGAADELRGPQSHRFVARPVPVPG